MKFALFLGCKIPFFLEHYAAATRAILEALDIELVELEFNCCGNPLSDLSLEALTLLGARNLALAQQQNLDILTPCKCCFGNLKRTAYFLNKNVSLKKEINGLLQAEDLRWDGRTQVKHLLSVLANDIGVEALAVQIKHRYRGLKIAAHYGCQALRPSRITNFDDPYAPTIFEKLVALTGAQTVEWPRRLECCGNPVWGKNNQLSLDLMQKKLNDTRQAGAHYLCAACTHCQMQFDTVQGTELAQQDSSAKVASILYPQLVGLSLGLPEAALGLENNKVDIRGVLEFLS
ncbi:MAG: CoB--CoM heterodisulfide reductase iron-sulfur subunit B family protein [Pseudomonadota bacterium]